MTALDRLDQIDARVGAATDLADICWEVVRQGPVTVSITAFNPEVIDLIAHAPTDLAAMAAALRAVLVLHRTIPVYAYADECGHDEDAHEVIVSDDFGYLCGDSLTGDYLCDECRTIGSGIPVEYPCPTVRLITRHLEDS